MSDTVPSKLTHRFADLNPFRSEGDEGGEELGEQLTSASVAGGGRRDPANNRDGLNVSHALRRFLAQQGVIGKDDVGDKDHHGKLQPRMVYVFKRSPVQIPSYLLQRGHSLSEYFISSSVSLIHMAPFADTDMLPLTLTAQHLPDR